METTQPHNQWEELSVSVGVRRLEHEVDDSSPKATRPHIPRDRNGNFGYFLLIIHKMLKLYVLDFGAYGLK